jgi:hypothetical protein
VIKEVCPGGLQIAQLAKGFKGDENGDPEQLIAERTWLYGSKHSSPGLVGLTATLRLEPEGEKIRYSLRVPANSR